MSLQLQVLAILGSLPGISYPPHVEGAISVAKLANLDLVRTAALFPVRPRVHVWSKSWIGLPSRQGLLRTDCNPHSRTNYYTTSFTLFTLPAAIVVYVLGIRGLLWVLTPALLFVRPQLKGHAFFDHSVHKRTNALSIDVRTAHFPMPRGAMQPILPTRARAWMPSSDVRAAGYDRTG